MVKSRVKSLILGAVAFVGVVASARAAHAAEYLCYVAFQPGNSVLGSEGNIHFTTFTGPSCTGAFIRQYFFCTTNATNTGCASSTLYRFERQGILAMLGVMQRAAAADQNVGVVTATCIGGGANCAGSLTVRAD
jgi:hypothetical protein